MQLEKFFNDGLQASDPQVAAIINRQADCYAKKLLLIASENFASQAVLDAQGSILTNKYAEGYPGKRYYGGCEYADQIEELARDRLKQLFSVAYANVQPHSGSQANQAVMLAILTPGDTFLAMDLSAGGHLSHGSPVNLSGKWFKAVSYGVTAEGDIDYEQVRSQALKHRPKVIICGASSFSRLIDFAKFRQIADEVNAYLWADIAHYAGLIAARIWPNPATLVDVMTTTTHKTLRGPRGGAIMTNHQDLAAKLDKAVFPGLQGGPLVHVIAAKAVAFKEAAQPAFRAYTQQVVNNAQACAKRLQEHNLAIVSSGTDCHMFLLNLAPLGLTGAAVQATLEQTNLVGNKNFVPFEKQSPRLASGIRLGSPSCTSRGLKEQEFALIADWISELVMTMAKQEDQLAQVVNHTRQQVEKLAASFPVYQSRF